MANGYPDSTFDPKYRIVLGDGYTNNLPVCQAGVAKSSQLYMDMEIKKAAERCAVVLERFKENCEVFGKSVNRFVEAVNDLADEIERMKRLL